MSYHFMIKSDITFGKGAVSELSGILGKYCFNKIMVVYDPGVKAAGIAGKILEQIDKTAVEAVIFDQVIPNPTNEIVEKAAALAKEQKVEGFVAVGGGSSIDMAKAVNVLMTNPGKIEEYGGVNRVKNPVLPLIAIPTTAGTSSEITNVSAMIDTEKVLKYVIIDPHMIPSYVIIDPELTRTMPASVTAATGMDAITHAVESYLSNMATPLTEYNALKGLELLHQYLKRAVTNGEDMEAREQMMLGCVITGFSFSNANLGLVHGIAHTLSAHFGLPHGMANAAVLPYVTKYNAVSCPQKVIDLAKAIGIIPSGNQEEDQYLLAEELLRMTKDIGIPSLSEQGVKKEAFVMLADEILKEPVVGFNPRQNITKEDLIRILEQAY